MTAPSNTRTAAADIADRTGFASVELHDETGQWSVWISPDQWWGFVDATVLDELASHADVYGVTVTRRHDGQPWIPSPDAPPADVLADADPRLQLATATMDPDLPDGAVGIRLSTNLPATSVADALLRWLDEFDLRDAVFGTHPDAHGFVRLIVRGTDPDGTPVVVVGPFHRRAAAHAVRIIGDEIDPQDVRALLTHLVACAGQKSCNH
ncbi:hypothetical protein [Amycolatopsis sp. NBC_01286]|uniref:hypothetical protein n=1 Tax=Amycolatopsis sp. NBC_01286 TaxID=2903560 RepID=UPI002E166864|nr:hypothetical protein OG570_48110 [Amycolatopsis sp. NBC_01286]